MSFEFLVRLEEVIHRVRRGEVSPAGEPVAPPPEPIRCWFLWQRPYVGPNGDVVPCCLVNRSSDTGTYDRG